MACVLSWAAEKRLLHHHGALRQAPIRDIPLKGKEIRRSRWSPHMSLTGPFVSEGHEGGSGDMAPDGLGSDASRPSLSAHERSPGLPEPIVSVRVGAPSTETPEQTVPTGFFGRSPPGPAIRWWRPRYRCPAPVGPRLPSPRPTCSLTAPCSAIIAAGTPARSSSLLLR